MPFDTTHGVNGLFSGVKGSVSGVNVVQIKSYLSEYDNLHTVFVYIFVWVRIFTRPPLMKLSRNPNTITHMLPLWKGVLYVFLCLFLFSFTSLLAQSPEDSIQIAQKWDEVNAHFAAGQYREALSAMRAMRPLFNHYPPSKQDKVANYYRSISHGHHALGAYDSSLIYGRRSWEGFRASLGDTNRITIDLHYEVGYLFHQLLSYDSALVHYQDALAEYEAFLGTDTDDVPLTLHQIAMVYQNLGMHEDALPYERRAYQLWKQLYGVNSDRVLTSTRSLGGLYQDMDQHDQSILYAQEGFAIAERLYADAPDRQVKHALRLVSAYRNAGQDSLTLHWINQAEKLFNRSGEGRGEYYAWIASNRSMSHRKQKEFPQAIRYMKQAVQAMETKAQQGALGKIYQADFYIQLAQTYLEAGQPDSVQGLLQLAGDIYRAYYPRRNFYVSYELAHLAFERRDTAALVPHSIRLLADIQGTPPLNSLSAMLTRPIESYPQARSITTLLRQGDWFWVLYEQYGDPTYLRWSQLAFEQLDRWYDPLRSNRVQPTPQMASFRKWISKGLLRCYAAQYMVHHDPNFLKQAFAAAEYGNSFALFNHLRHQTHLQYAGVPDSLIQQEASLRAQLSYLSTTYLTQSHTDTIAGKQLKLLQQQYEGLMAHLQDKHPAYFSLLVQEPVGLETFQSMLNRDQGAVVLILSDSVLYSFALASDQATCQATPLPADFQTQLQAYRQVLTDYPAYLKDPNLLSQQIGESGYALYEMLLAQSLAQLPDKTEELLLIPNGELSQIPFETLLTQAPASATGSFADFPFLLKSYNLVYGYSASLYWDQHHADRRSSNINKLASFAPSYRSDFLASLPASEQSHINMLVREGWYDLKGAQGEAEAIADMWQGDLFLADQASKQQFLKAAPAYGLLHLAMHTSVQPQNPLLSSLIFSETDSDSLRRLYAAELFGLQLQAEMVVLSGCNTGFGTEDAGLGNFSLAKAFQYAGSPSVIMSLWKVPDAATQQVMLQFYQGLKAGGRKSASLRDAKLSYLEEVMSPEQTHPIYWAGFIASGNNEPLYQHPFPLWWVLLSLGLVVLGGLGYVNWKNTKGN